MNNNENMTCLDSHKDETCTGTVDFRPAMSPSGKWFPRCEGHLAKRMKHQERLSRDYGVPMYY